MSAAFFLIFALSAYAAPLPKLSIEPGSATVSGISAGAFMAEQLQVALSSRIHGVGSVAGGIYACAEGSLFNMWDTCIRTPQLVDPAEALDYARRAADRGAIDSLDNLARSRAYLFHSEADPTVGFDSLRKLQAFVEAFTPGEQVKVVVEKKFAHAFPTKDYGAPCDQGGAPFLIKCGRDVAGEILEQLYGPSGGRLNQPAPKATGYFIPFEQRLYTLGYGDLYPEGYVYVPKACRKGSCRLHIALHGCKMNPDFIGAQFREHAGYNEWADTNRIVVIYPAADRGVMNPYGCWDWFGSTGPGYATKLAPQIRFIASILDFYGA